MTSKYTGVPRVRPLAAAGAVLAVGATAWLPTYAATPPTPGSPSSQPEPPSGPPGNSSATQPASAPAVERSALQRPPWKFLELSPTGPGYLSQCDSGKCESRLRYNEDYSFLEKKTPIPDGQQGPPPGSAQGPAPDSAQGQEKAKPMPTPQDDWLLKFKNINLGDRWRVDFGGEYRLRVENRTNPVFGLEDQTSNIQQNYRWFGHANVHYGNLFRVFVQGIFTNVEHRQGPVQLTQEDHGDIHQLFGDLRVLGEEIPLTLRIGRQELSYGHVRLIGPFEWISNRRTFDGIKLFYTSEKWDIDAFLVRPVTIKRTQLDPWNDDYNFYGVYNTVRPWKGINIDSYFLGVDRSDEAVNPNGHEGGRSTYTMGARLYGSKPPFDYDTEVAGQWGRWAGDSVGAWLVESDAGYTFPHPTKPRIGAGVGLETGDKNPFDRRVGTWDQLFPYDMACLSFPDLVGRQNVQRATVSAEIWPVPDRLKLTSLFHMFWLHEASDAYYNAGGNPVLRDLPGLQGRELGSELDVLVEWKLTNHASMLLGYSHFWNGRFIENMVSGDDQPDLFFIQYQFKF